MDQTLYANIVETQSSDDPSLRRVLIVGGGAGGLELATMPGNTLGKRKRASITLLDRTRIHVWIFADRQGVIRLWNTGAEAVFGYSSEEVVGKCLDVIIPERLRRAHWKAFQRAVETGHTQYGRQVMVTHSIHKNGRKVYVDLSFAIVNDCSGEVVGAVAVASDATEHYLSDATLRKRVAELERQLQTSSGWPSRE